MSLLVLLVILAIFILIILLFKRQSPKPDPGKADTLPVKRRKLLSANELAFYQALKSVIPDHRDISCKCRLEDIMFVENGPQKQSIRNKIKCRHVDFLIFDPDNGFTDFAIELDDSSHKKKLNEDALKDQLFATINMPLIRIKAKAAYRPEEIKIELEKAFNQYYS